MNNYIEFNTLSRLYKERRNYLQDGRVGETGFIFCGKHPLPMQRIQVSDPGANLWAILLKKVG